MVGFGFGLIFIYFIFGNRACAWLPENRVKNMIAEKEIFIGDSVQALMDCAGITNDDIYRLLNDDGDVDFKNSDTQVSPKYYLIRGKKKDTEISITYALYDEKSEVVGFDYGSSDCSTSLRNGNKSVVSVPDFEVINIIESEELRILEKAACQMECLGLKEADVIIFHRSANTIIEESAPKASPNPHYVMQGKIKGKSYKIKYIIGENRTRIVEIAENDLSCKCEVYDK